MLDETDLYSHDPVVEAEKAATRLTAMGDHAQFIQDAGKGRATVACSWDDAKHLTPEMRREMWDRFPEWQREARRTGKPISGKGMVYKISEERFTFKQDINEMKRHNWLVGYALDVGWHVNAAIFGYWDPDEDVVWVYDEYYAGEAVPEIHAAMLKRKKADQMLGAIDPASNGRSQKDGAQLKATYIELGLNVVNARNGIEDGLGAVATRLATGRLKIHVKCEKLLKEMRAYHFDENGKIAPRQADHACDAMRYLISTGDIVFGDQPAVEVEEDNGRWAGERNRVSGY